MTSGPTASNPFEPVELTPSDMPTAPRPKFGFTWVEFGVVVLIIGILVGLLTPAVRTAKAPARRMQCSNNIKQLGLALHNYHEHFNALPPAYTVDAEGHRLHSWRTLLLPYLEHQAVYDKIDLNKPWDDPVNIKAVEGFVPQVYLCPSNSDSPSKTLYQAIVDPQSCFPGSTCARFNDITDDTATTLMIIEVPLEKGVDWMSPNDCDMKTLLAITKKTKAAHQQILNAAMADGSVRAIPLESTEIQRRAIVTIDGNESAGLDD